MKFTGPLALIFFFVALVKLYSMYNQDNGVCSEINLKNPLQFVNTSSDEHSSDEHWLSGCKDKIIENIANYGFSTSSKDWITLFTHSITTTAVLNWCHSLNPVILNDPEYIKTISQQCFSNTRIAIVLVTNGRSPNIQEWLVYYIMLGVKMVRIFDDSIPGSFEQDRFLAAVEPFVIAGFVEHSSIYDSPISPDHPGDSRQVSLYNDFLSHSRLKYDWVSFLDADEYLVPHGQDCLAQALADYEAFAGLTVSWTSLSPKGVPIHQTSRSHFEQYFHGFVPNPEPGGKTFGKIVVQPRFTESVQIHFGIPNEGYQMVSWDKHPAPITFDPDYESARLFEIIHYSMGDMQFAFFEKVCGPGHNRKSLIDFRAKMLLDSISENTFAFNYSRMQDKVDRLNQALFSHRI